MGDGRWRATSTMLSESVQRVTLEEDGRRLTWSDVIALWTDPHFATFYSGLLADAPFSHFFWECPPVTTSRAAELPFEHVIVKAPPFQAADPDSFAEHLRSEGPAAAFANLGGDAILVAPCERGHRSLYGHVAAFVRGASDDQRAALWALVGHTMCNVLDERGERPTWLSTEGTGVPWLHVRLDSRPWYYHHSAYRNFVTIAGGSALLRAQATSTTTSATATFIATCTTREIDPR